MQKKVAATWPLVLQDDVPAIAGSGTAMERAAVLIGVKQTGGMPALQAVESSVAHVAAWLREQGLPEEHLRIVSDTSGPVTVSAIKDAVSSLLDLGHIEQLIVYFSGHGVSVGASEFWLLSGAPANADEAVNLDLSISLARRATVPHIILVSDTCRTPATDTRGQTISGSAIFPNVRPRQPESSVDVFFGCGLGTPSLEVQVGDDAGGQFRAVFTDSLVHALRGNAPGILDAITPSPAMVVRAWPLKKHLKHDVVKRIRDLRLSMQTTQSPDARITSDPERWVSFLKDGAPAGAGAAPPPPPPPSVPVPDAPPSQPMPAPFDMAKVADTMILDMLNQRAGAFPELVASRAPRRVDARSKPLKDTVRRLRQSGQVNRVSDRGWIQVDGLEATELLPPTALPPEFLGPRLSWLRLAEGGYIQVPTVHGFVTTVTGDSGRVEDVGLVPAAAYGSPGPTRTDAPLSALISGAALAGGFNPDPELIAQIYTDSKVGAALSFGATLHLAYAMHDWNMQPELAELNSSSANIYGFYLYDLAMLAGQIYAGESLDKPVLPSYPMITKGWNLVEGFVAEPRAQHAALKRTLYPTLWTTLKEKGYRKISYE